MINLRMQTLPRAAFAKIGGANRGRTDDLMNAIHALYQLSYGPNLFGIIKDHQQTRKCIEKL